MCGAVVTWTALEGCGVHVTTVLTDRTSCYVHRVVLWDLVAETERDALRAEPVGDNLACIVTQNTRVQYWASGASWLAGKAITVDASLVEVLCRLTTVSFYVEAFPEPAGLECACLRSIRHIESEVLSHCCSASIAQSLHGEIVLEDGEGEVFVRHVLEGERPGNTLHRIVSETAGIDDGEVVRSEHVGEAVHQIGSSTHHDPV